MTFTYSSTETPVDLAAKDAEIAALRAENEALKGEVERLTRERNLARELLNGDDVTAFELGTGRVITLEANLADAEAALAALRGEVREVVVEVEWEGHRSRDGSWDFVGEEFCTRCDGFKSDGHAPDCRLAALLKRVGP
ncbi:MAG: hypothetical protein IPO00_08790 [Betaproteobacteria bacterium]|nr:hypothetical protein [Betaproteobacteria bacterium]